MKKLTALLIAILLIFAFAGCGNTSPAEEPVEETVTEETSAVAGHTYVFEKIEVDGDVFELDAVKGRQVTFNEDGTFVLTGYRDEEIGQTVADMNGTYEENGDTLSMTFNVTPETITFDDGTGIYDSETSFTEEWTIDGDAISVVAADNSVTTYRLAN